MHLSSHVNSSSLHEPDSIGVVLVLLEVDCVGSSVNTVASRVTSVVGVSVNTLTVAIVVGSEVNSSVSSSVTSVVGPSVNSSVRSSFTFSEYFDSLIL